MQDYGPVASEETPDSFDPGAEAVRLSQQRERKHFRGVLRQMSTAFLVETMRDTAGKLEPKAEDLVREAADRLDMAWKTWEAGNSQ